MDTSSPSNTFRRDLDPIRERRRRDLIRRYGNQLGEFAFRLERRPPEHRLENLRAEGETA